MDNTLPKRKVIRLKSQSYSENYTYFLTILCKNRSHLLGKVEVIPERRRDPVRDGVLDGPRVKNSENVRVEVRLSDIGTIVDEKIREINAKSDAVEVDKYVIMPNHIHLLVSIRSASGASRTPPPTKHDATFDRANEAIPKFVSYFKRSTNKMCGIDIWQRGYHDHVIRDSSDYESHWTYIDNNPYRWAEDEYFN